MERGSGYESPSAARTTTNPVENYFDFSGMRAKRKSMRKSTAADATTSKLVNNDKYRKSETGFIG